MFRYIIQRLLLLPVLILLFSIIVFGLVQAPPGDFLTSYISTLAASGSSMDDATVEALRVQFGVDQPFMVQYGRWMSGLLRGDLGRSLEYQRSNADLIGERLLLTIALALFAFVITWIIAIPAGIYSATHPNSLLDYFFTVLNYVGVAIPNFLLALVLMWFAFDRLGISITGLFSPEFVQAPWSWARVVDLLKHIWVPAIVLGVAGTARLTRVMRELAGRAEQAVRHHRSCEGTVRMAAGDEVPGPPGVQPTHQHDRLVSAAALLRQPDRRHGHEHSEHRPAAAAGFAAAGYVLWRAASCSSTVS